MNLGELLIAVLLVLDGLSAYRGAARVERAVARVYQELTRLNKQVAALSLTLSGHLLWHAQKTGHPGAHPESFVAWAPPSQGDDRIQERSTN